ncbi:DUF3298 and DUF4163 domain-containing protein [Candidatus Parcubacteria bacterium]|nr:DUF3298 and DUF4163 domain-containing protein [Candidatus Parcubacteria bacterium]
MNKKLVVSVLAVGLVVGFWFTKDLFLKDNQPLASPEPSLETTSQFLLKTRLVEINQIDDKYEIQVKYPEFFNSAYPEAELIANQLIKSEFQDQISEFKANLIEDIIDLPEAKSAFSTDYSEVILTDRLASIKLDSYQYAAGAAHPNSFYSVFNYDFEKNRQINLTELFNPDSDFLPVISEITFQDLKSQLGETDPFVEGTIKEGLLPIKANFKNFVFDKDEITFLFDPYQLGAYAIGPRSVKINYDQLKDLMDKSELLSLINK